jgi:hypothetical protein
MADVKLTSRADFRALVDEGLEETLTLEYKASPALSRQSKEVQELCKDVSAMANSAGGLIIYGIEEDKKTHKPVRVDDGVTDEKITREWIQQIISSNVHPRIDRISVQRVPLSDTGFGYVISIEPTLNGPHQAPDKKYYKRFELEAKPMDDYEIRDIMRRATTPELEVQLTFGNGQMRLDAEFGGVDQDESKPFFISCSVVNHSPTPAYFAIVEVYVDNDLKSPFALAPFKVARMESNDTRQTFRVYQRTLASPPGVPVFKEAVHETHQGQIPLQLPIGLWKSSMIYFETNVQAPGFTKREEWFINCNGGRMQLRRAPKA